MRTLFLIITLLAVPAMTIGACHRSGHGCSGAAVPNANVVTNNLETGVKWQAVKKGDGYHTWLLVRLCIETGKTGGRAKLPKVGQGVKPILHAIGPYDLFEPQEDEGSAERSFSADAMTRSVPGSEYFIG